MDPVTLGLCSQIDLDFEVNRAAKERPESMEDHGQTLVPAEVTTARAPAPATQEEVFGKSARRVAEEEDNFDADKVFGRLKDSISGSDRTVAAKLIRRPQVTGWGRGDWGSLFLFVISFPALFNDDAPMSASPYDRDLDRNPANFQPLTPHHFPGAGGGGVSRSHRRSSMAICVAANATFTRAAGASPARWTKAGMKRGDTVSVMLANTPAMLECHYGVPMIGAVLNTLNTRLDAADPRLHARSRGG